jgi:hypothetical protein
MEETVRQRLLPILGTVGPATSSQQTTPYAGGSHLPDTVITPVHIRRMSCCFRRLNRHHAEIGGDGAWLNATAQNSTDEGALIRNSVGCRVNALLDALSDMLRSGSFHALWRRICRSRRQVAANRKVWDLMCLLTATSVAGVRSWITSRAAEQPAPLGFRTGAVVYGLS